MSVVKYTTGHRRYTGKWFTAWLVVYKIRVFMIFSDGNCIIFKLDSSEILTYLTVYMYMYICECVRADFTVDWPGESSSSPVNKRFGCVCLSKCPMYRMWPVRSPLATTWSFSWTCNLWLKKGEKINSSYYISFTNNKVVGFL